VIFSGEKAGDPHHGSWSDSTGKVLTPDALEVDIVGDTPATDGLERSGDCYLFRAAAVTPAETAGQPGETWLNYGLLAGSGRRLYGKNLGAGKWLVRGTSGKVWLASLDMVGEHLVGSGWDGDISCQLELSRFGVFGGPEQKQTIILNVVETLGGYADPLDAETWTLHLDDVSDDGRTAVFAARCGLYEIPVLGMRPWTFGLFWMTITGEPPDAEAVCVSVAYDDLLDMALGTASSVIDPPVIVLDESDEEDYRYTPGKSVTAAFPQLCYGKAGAEGGIDMVRLAVEYEMALTGEFSKVSDDEMTAGGTASGSGTVKLMVGDVEHYSISFSFSTEYAWAVPGGMTSATCTLTVGGVNVTAALDGYATWGEYAEGSMAPGPASLNDYAVLCKAPEIYANFGRLLFVYGDRDHGGCAISVFVQRYSNAVYGLVVCPLTAAPDAVLIRALRQFPLCGSTSVVSTTYNYPAESDFPIFASEHPVTGEIILGAEAACWV
jgi:hypothetical protein